MPAWAYLHVATISPLICLFTLYQSWSRPCRCAHASVLVTNSVADMIAKLLCMLSLYYYGIHCLYASALHCCSILAYSLCSCVHVQVFDRPPEQPTLPRLALPSMISCVVVDCGKVKETVCILIEQA